MRAVFLTSIRSLLGFTACFLAAISLSAQEFTDLRPFNFVSTAGVSSTAQGPAVTGWAPATDVPLTVRWSRATGIVPLNVPEIAPLPFRPEHVSADGAVVVGRGSGSGSNLFRPSAYRWSADGSFDELSPDIRDSGFSVRTRVSADGSTVVGFGASAGFRWTRQTGTVSIGAKLDGLDVIGPDNQLFFANGVSANGSVIAGMNTVDPFGLGEAARWTAATGPVGLGFLFNNGLEETSLASDLSADGSILVGTAGTEDFSEAFRWTEATGMVGLGVLPGTDFSFASAISSDGSKIFGGAGLTPFSADAFMWTTGAGMQRLIDVLAVQYGLADDVAGWRLRSVTDLSADGRYVLGMGTGPDGRSGYFLADLGMTPVPEPSTFGLIGAVGLLTFAIYRRRRARTAEKWCEPVDAGITSKFHVISGH